jgi:NADPH:quinone reductase-like Zn-dependent oxidoreductase
MGMPHLRFYAAGCEPRAHERTVLLAPSHGDNRKQAYGRAAKQGCAGNGEFMSMKAVRIHAFGGPEVLRYEDVPKPLLEPGTVLVEVHAVGINPVDWKCRTGGMIIERPLPIILGWDISGAIEAVAPDVTKFKADDAVYGMVGFPDLGNAYAEYVVAKPEHLALKPANVSHIEAGSLPLVALTAWQAIFDHADIQAGQRVLIHAAAGGVGSIDVQLAKWKGAYVIGTASVKNADFVRSLGADEVIDYTKTRFEDVVGEVDLVLDNVGGETVERSMGVVKPGGKLVSIAGRPDEAAAKALGIEVFSFLVEPNASQLEQIAALVDAGTLKPVASTVFPLEQTRQAHELSETRHLQGKIVLQVR